MRLIKENRTYKKTTIYNHLNGVQSLCPVNECWRKLFDAYKPQFLQFDSNILAFLTYLNMRKRPKASNLFEIGFILWL